MDVDFIRFFNIDMVKDILSKQSAYEIAYNLKQLIRCKIDRI